MNQTVNYLFPVNVWEAAMFAGHQKLSNLVYIIDNNDLGATGSTENTLGVEPVPEKFEAVSYTHLTLPTIYSV